VHTRNKVLTQLQFNQTQFSKINKAYFRKSVYYASYIDHYDYNKVKVTQKQTEREYRKATTGTKSTYSLARARERLYRLIECNIGKFGGHKPVFFTLTTKDQLREIKDSNKKIKACIRRVNRYLGYNVKYVIVPERHASSAIHYHGVFFNLPYVDVKFFRHELWGYGYVDLQLPRKIRSVSAYLAKYLTKDTKDNLQLNTKTYFTSRGLLKPIELYDSELPHGIVQIEQLVRLKDGIKTKYKKI